MSSTTSLFGTRADGRPVQAIRLRAGELTAVVLTHGATLHDVRLAGTPWPLTLGVPTMAAYEGPCRWFGSIAGPVANRIRGASAKIAGKRHVFETNEAGRTTLHSGSTGTDIQLWSMIEASETAVTLALDLPDGLGGFPGNRHLRAHFALTAPADLTLTLSATTDQPTLMNLANHSYWNLDGTATTAGHSLRVMADRYLPVDGDKIPFMPAPVATTPYDLRTPRRLPLRAALDHNFCLANGARPLTPAARLSGAKGVRLDIATTAAGLQVYDGVGLNSGQWPGHMGAPYGPHAGIALEPQAWPDAPGRADFPSIALQPGENWQQVSRFRFSRTLGA